METKDRSASRCRFRVSVLVIVLVLLALWFLVGVVVPNSLFPDQTGRSSFGDQFGAVNALFSGLAFVGVIIALWLQRDELKVAIREQRDAAQQHASIVKAQVILTLMDEFRSHEWGAAHSGIARWRRSRGEGFVQEFMEKRGEEPETYEIDIHRRTLLKPCRKIHSLWKAKVIDDGFTREIVTEDIAETLITTIKPMETAMFEKCGKMLETPFYEFVHHLYPHIRAEPATESPSSP